MNAQPIHRSAPIVPRLSARTDSVRRLIPDPSTLIQMRLLDTAMALMQQSMYRNLASFQARESKHRGGGRAGLAGKAARQFREKTDRQQKRARKIAEASRRANRRKAH